MGNRRIRFPFWITFFAAGALIVLVGLGGWQLQRLQWKLDLTQTIDQQIALPPVPFPSGSFDPDAWQYRRLEVNGQFHHDKELYMFGHSSRGEPGYLVITPLQREDGSFILFNRGWVPPERRDPATRPDGQIAGTVTLEGLGRKPWPQHSFVADNEPDANIWFFGDLDAMAAKWGITDYAPMFMEADAAPNPGGWPLGGQSKTKLRNDHLSYALTWFALAIILIGVYIAYVIAESRKQADEQEQP